MQKEPKDTPNKQKNQKPKTTEKNPQIKFITPLFV